MSGLVVIASGGTGGHMFPAIALGEALAARGIPVAYAVDARGAKYLDADATYFEVPSASPSGSLRKRFTAMIQIGLGCARASLRFLRNRPTAVAAFGGYACVPAGIAARITRVPLVLHEQNAVLGRAHRLLLKFAEGLALTFAGTEGVPEDDHRVVGNPVRPGFDGRQHPNGDAPLRVTVIGGSQGARVFADVVPEAVGRLAAAERAGLRLAQQVRPEDMERVSAAYRQLAFDVELAPFFEDMPQRLASTDLVIGRAGASAVAEQLVVGVPAVLVPYPHAADDHQRANAAAIAKAGAAVVIDPDEFSAERLVPVLRDLLKDRDRLRAMADAAGRLARPDAAERLADYVLEIAR